MYIDYITNKVMEKVGCQPDSQEMLVMMYVNDRYKDKQ